MSMVFENTDYDNQFNSGIKIIQAAFFNQSNYFKNEISGLANEIIIKNTKINKLEKSNASLYTEKEEYEKTIQNLLSENSSLIQLIERGKLSDRIINKSKDLNCENKTLEMNNFCSLLESTKATLKKNRSENIIIKPKEVNSIANVNFNINGKGNGNGTELKTDYIETRPKIRKGSKTSTSNVPFCISTEYDNCSRIRTTHRTFRDKKLREENFKTQPMIESQREHMNNDNNDDNNNNAINNYRNDNQQDSNKRQKGNFFKKCRSIMSPKDYSQMIEIVRLANSYQITKKETYDRISYLLEKKYPNFISEFEELLFPKET